MHFLDGAYEQINGAREHLDSLKPEIDAFAKTIVQDVSLKYKKGIINIKGRQLEAPIGTATAPINRPAPLRAKRLIGEVIQSLRIALDYLVYELACFDSKSIVEKTQFVIVDSEKEFRDNLWHLKGLSGEHRTMFERLQHYNGCNWTKLIQTLSNPAKHETLTAVRQSTCISINDSNTEAILAGQQVDVNSYASIKITFSDGSPVIELLNNWSSRLLRRLKSSSRSSSELSISYPLYIEMGYIPQGKGLGDRLLSTRIEPYQTES